MTSPVSASIERIRFFTVSSNVGKTYLGLDGGMLLPETEDIND